MVEHSAPLTKADYRIWLGYFCIPFLLILLASIAWWVVLLRTCTKDLGGLLHYLDDRWPAWQILLGLLIFTPLILTPFLQSLLDKKSDSARQKAQQPPRPSRTRAQRFNDLICRISPWPPRNKVYCCIRWLGSFAARSHQFTNLMCRSYPLLARSKIYWRSKRIDLLICAALGLWASYLLATTLIYESIFTSGSAFDPMSHYWLLLYGLLLLPALGVLQFWDRLVTRIVLCFRLNAFSLACNNFICCKLFTQLCHCCCLRCMELTRAALKKILRKHRSFALIFALVFASKDLNTTKKKSFADQSGRLQSDAPLKPSEPDLFKWDDKAKAFSGAVLEASDGIAFGVEAPWGTGKTSFINLCEAWWLDEQNKYKVVVYRFELLTYAGNPNLIQQFVLSLLDALEQHHYLPELRAAVQGYLGSLQGALELSRGPLKLTLNNQPGSIEEALNQISVQLERRLPEAVRVIVVIDDLDRVAPENVRDLLFALHKCFALPRLRYVLCYDQQQLAHKAELHRQHGGDLASQTLYEFMEKFVGARIYLQVPRWSLEKEWERMQDQWKTNDPIWKALVSEVMNCAIQLVTTQSKEQPRELLREALQKWQNSSDSVESKEDIGKALHPYALLLGNLRQLRHLFNQLCLCWPEGIPIQDHDFNKSDLLHLLLLQKELPSVYRELRAIALADEHKNLLLKNNSEHKGFAPGDGLDPWLESLLPSFPSNHHPYNKPALLLKALFHPNYLALDHSGNISTPGRVAANQSNLPRYIDLIEYSITSDLRESPGYIYKLRQKWLEQSQQLCDLLKIVVEPHDNKKPNWQDKDEYALWGLLLGGLDHYTKAQQNELLAEYLKALPRFISRDTFTPRRFAMARLLGEAIRNLLVSEGATSAKKLLEIAWLKSEHGMLNQQDPVKSLLGWQDAVLVCNELHYLELNEDFRHWMQKTFWAQFLHYPKVSWDEQLSTLAKALQGTRQNAEQQEKQANAREWLVKHWRQLYDLAALGPDSELREKIQNKLERCLFETCWGNSNPTDEQLNCWLDYIYYNSLSSTRNAYASPSFRSRFKSYATQHAKEIEKVRQQRNQSDTETKQLLGALTDLCQQNWNDFVKNPSGAPAEN